MSCAAVGNCIAWIAIHRVYPLLPPCCLSKLKAGQLGVELSGSVAGWEAVLIGLADDVLRAATAIVQVGTLGGGRLVAPPRRSRSRFFAVQLYLPV